MGDYEDDGDGGYDESEYGGHDQQGKRKMEADKNSNNKKRFVWPEALHRDFVAAVFDVGLKHANSRLLQEMLPSSHLITGDNLKSHLLKFRLQRDRSRDDYMSHYEMSVSGMNGGGAVAESSRSHQQSHHRQEGGDSSSNVAAELARISAAERAYIAEHSLRLKQQIDSISTVIAEQTSFLQLLKNSIAKQVKLHGQLMAKMTQMNPAYTSSGLIDDVYLEQLQQHQQQQLHQHQHQQQHLQHQQQQLQQQQQQQQQQLQPPLQERRMSISATSDGGGSSAGGGGGGGSAVGPSTRAEIQIMSEMRSHMDMHRQLLMRKEDQLSQHVPIQKPGQGQGPQQPSSPESVNNGLDPNAAAAGASSSSSSSSSSGGKQQSSVSRRTRAHSLTDHYSQEATSYHDNQSDNDGQGMNNGTSSSSSSSSSYMDHAATHGQSSSSSGGADMEYAAEQGLGNEISSRGGQGSGADGGKGLGSAGAQQYDEQTMREMNKHHDTSAPDWNWENDLMVSNLFSFLLEPEATDPRNS